MRIWIVAIVAAIGAAFLITGTDAAQDVVLTGQYQDADVVVNIGYDRAAWHFEGQWAGRDLAIQQDCDDGYHRVYAFMHMNGPKGKDGRASLPFPETATSCEGVVIDFDGFTEVSNHVVLVKGLP